MDLFHVKELRDSDISSLASLLLEQMSGDEGNFRFRLEQRLQGILKMKESHRRPTILAAFTGDEFIVGCLLVHWLYELWADHPEALISSLYVGQAWRNQGVGTCLLQAGVSIATRFSCSRLWLESNRLNPAYLKQFYAKRGWKERDDLSVFEFELGNDI
jgi:GNAT superfamily N-acetyltransferase